MSSSNILFVVRNPRSVFTFVKSSLEEGNKVAYLTTSSKADLIANISRYWSGVRKYTSSGDLSVRSAYYLFPRDVGHKAVNKNAHTSYVKPLGNSASDATVIICPGAVTAYVKTGSHASHIVSVSPVSQVNKIIEFEASVSRRFPSGNVICCIFDQLVRGLDLVPLLNLMKCHALVIGHGSEITPLLEPALLGAIKRGIDVAMGKGSSTLILKTLQYVYKINESTILQDPVVWSIVLKRVCGKHADQILDAVTEELRKLVLQAE